MNENISQETEGPNTELKITCCVNKADQPSDLAAATSVSNWKENRESPRKHTCHADLAKLSIRHSVDSL